MFLLFAASSKSALFTCLLLPFSNSLALALYSDHISKFELLKVDLPGYASLHGSVNSFGLDVLSHSPMNFTYFSFNEILMLHFMRFYLMKYLQWKAPCLQYRPYHPVMTTWTPCSLNSGHAPSHSQSNKHVKRTLILDLDFGSSCAINVLFQSLCTICCFWSF